MNIQGRQICKPTNKNNKMSCIANLTSLDYFSKIMITKLK